MKKVVVLLFLVLLIFSFTSSKVFASIGEYTGTSFDTAASGNTGPNHVTFLDDFFWVTASSGRVYKYNSDGTYTGTLINLSASFFCMTGITNDGTALWIMDECLDSEVQKYNTDGTSAGVSFDTDASGNGNPEGILFYGDFLWIVDDNDAEVYKYETDGTYTNTSFDTAVSGNGNPKGITYYDNYFWITDGTDREVYRYETDGTYTGLSFDTNGYIAVNPIGITVADDFFYVVHGGADDQVYKLETQPETLTVNSLLDDGDGTCTEIKCTLRDAIAESAGGDTIEFSVTGTAILDANMIININHDLTIIGPGADVLTIDTDGASSFIDQQGGNLNISGFTFTNANTFINNSGGTSLDLVDVVFEDNNYNSSPLFLQSGDVTITNCVFRDNSEASAGGGAIYVSVDSLSITNCTFLGNSATGFNGGAIYVNAGNVSIINSTFSDNTADSGGNIYDAGASSISVVNSIFTTGNPDNCAGVAPFTSEGHNIDSGTSCGFAGEGDLSSTDPMLDPLGLQDNGGSVQTIALLAGSPAINAGDDGEAPDEDARGVARVGISDIGAYEFEPEEEEEETPRISSSGSTRRVVMASPIPIITPIPSNPALECLPGHKFSNITGLPCPITIEVNTPSNQELNKFIFKNDLRLKMTHPDVKELQKYLNTHGFPVALLGPGSLGQETDKFGLFTYYALIKFQFANNITPPVGFFGPITRGVINFI